MDRTFVRYLTLFSRATDRPERVYNDEQRFIGWCSKGTFSAANVPGISLLPVPWHKAASYPNPARDMSLEARRALVKSLRYLRKNCDQKVKLP